MEMEKIVVEEISKFITGRRDDEKMMKDLHKTSFVRGYHTALDDIERIIGLAENLKKGS